MHFKRVLNLSLQLRLVSNAVFRPNAKQIICRTALHGNLMIRSVNDTTQNFGPSELKILNSAEIFT